MDNTPKMGQAVKSSYFGRAWFLRRAGVLDVKLMLADGRIVFEANSGIVDDATSRSLRNTWDMSRPNPTLVRVIWENTKGTKFSRLGQFRRAFAKAYGKAKEAEVMKAVNPNA